MKVTRGLSPITIILAAGCFATAVSMGVRSTMGIYLDPISVDLGISTGSFGLAIAIQNLIWGLGQPIAGAISDRYGSARVLVAGGVLYILGLLVAGADQTTAGITIGLGFLTGLGLAGLSFAVILASVGRLVEESRRTAALATTTAFGSLGQFFLIPVTQNLISEFGWRKSLFLGIALIAIATLCVRPLRSQHPETSSQQTTTTSRETLRLALNYRSYVLLLVGFSVCGFHVTFIGLHLPKYLEDVGQTTRIAALALATIGLFNIGGTMAIGWLGTRYSNTKLLAILYGIRGIVFACMVAIPMTAEVALVSSAVIGLVWLSTVPLTSAIVLKQFGPEHAGILFGFVFLSHQIGAFIGSYGAGLYRDAYGSYSGYWWLASILGIGAAVVHLFIDEGPYQSTSAPKPGLSSKLWKARRTIGASVSTVITMIGLGIWSYIRIGEGEILVAHQQAAIICVLHMPFGPLG
ncbi:MAG TPA: MFS transporter [Acidimicrobiaceae bacterium]|nr:MFS transporter [Acidimicrobiaceae bacterium]